MTLCSGFLDCTVDDCQRLGHADDENSFRFEPEKGLDCLGYINNNKESEETT